MAIHEWVAIPIIFVQKAPTSSEWLQYSTAERCWHWLSRTSVPLQFKPSKTMGVFWFVTCGILSVRAFGSVHVTVCVLLITVQLSICRWYLCCQVQVVYTQQRRQDLPIRNYTLFPIVHQHSTPHDLMWHCSCLHPPASHHHQYNLKHLWNHYIKI